LQAINKSLEGLPVKLQEGSLGSVAVNLPLQSILTAPLSMAVDRLELSLVLQRSYHSRQGKPTNSDGPFGDPLAQSVAGVAQEFISEELESSSLRESIVMEENDKGPGYSAVDDDMSTHVPGSLNPFIEEALPNRASKPAEKDMELLDDVEGVSVLAQVIERLLARLSFKGTNITIHVIHEDHAEVVLCLRGISYITEERQESTPEVGTLEVPVGEKRTIRLDGIEVTVRDLTQKEEEPMKRGLDTSPVSEGNQGPLSSLLHDSPHAEYGDSIDDDEEEMDASMTESMVSLPPRAPFLHSEPGSPTSTVYFSTTSIRAHTPPPHSPDPPPLSPSVSSPKSLPASKPSATTSLPIHIAPEASSGEVLPLKDERAETTSILQREVQLIPILSFGKDPVVITLITPPPRMAPATPSATPTTFTGPEVLKLNISVGLITVALQTTHVNAIISMANFIQPKPSNPQPSTHTGIQIPGPGNPSGLPLLASLHSTSTVRGIQLFIFKSNPPHAPSYTAVQELFDHPTSSNVQVPHVYFHLKGIEVLYLPGIDSAKRSGGIRGGLKDLSAFYISSSPQPGSWMASPILIVDHHLPSQYDPSVGLEAVQHTISVLDWTNPSSHPLSGRPKQSHWRVKGPPPSIVGGLTTEMSDMHEGAMLEAVSLHMDSLSEGAHVDIAPLHVFIDTAMLDWFLKLTEEIAPSTSPEGGASGGEWDEDMPDSTGNVPTSNRAATRLTEKRQGSHTRTPRVEARGLPGLNDFDGQEKERLTNMMLADMEAEKASLQEVRDGLYKRFPVYSLLRKFPDDELQLIVRPYHRSLGFMCAL